MKQRDCTNSVGSFVSYLVETYEDGIQRDAAELRLLISTGAAFMQMKPSSRGSTLHGHVTMMQHLLLS